VALLPSQSAAAKPISCLGAFFVDILAHLLFGGIAMKQALLAIALTSVLSGPVMAENFGPTIRTCNDAQARALMNSKAGGFIVFHADWCPTCAVQNRVLAGMVTSKPLSRPVTICKVDHDKEMPLKILLQVYQQSTIVKVQSGSLIDRRSGITDEYSLTSFMN
jgi:thioredoxin 1